MVLVSLKCPTNSYVYGLLQVIILGPEEELLRLKYSTSCLLHAQRRAKWAYKISASPEQGRKKCVHC